MSSYLGIFQQELTVGLGQGCTEALHVTAGHGSLIYCILTLIPAVTSPCLVSILYSLRVTGVIKSTTLHYFSFSFIAWCDFLFKWHHMLSHYEQYSNTPHLLCTNFNRWSNLARLDEWMWLHKCARTCPTHTCIYRKDEDKWTGDKLHWRLIQPFILPALSLLVLAFNVG